MQTMNLKFNHASEKMYNFCVTRDKKKITNKTRKSLAHNVRKSCHPVPPCS